MNIWNSSKVVTFFGCNTSIKKQRERKRTKKKQSPNKSFGSFEKKRKKYQHHIRIFLTKIIISNDRAKRNRTRDDELTNQFAKNASHWFRGIVVLARECYVPESSFLIEYKQICHHRCSYWPLVFSWLCVQFWLV